MNEFVSEDPASDGTVPMTWEVTPVDARSRVDIRADDVPDGINAADHAAGLSASLEGKSVTTSPSWRPEGLLRPLNTPTWTPAARALRVLTVDAGASAFRLGRD
jgi:hypothetical protein